MGYVRRTNQDGSEDSGNRIAAVEQLSRNTFANYQLAGRH